MDDPSNLEIHGSILPKENIKILETIKKRPLLIKIITKGF